MENFLHIRQGKYDSNGYDSDSEVVELELSWYF